MEYLYMLTNIFEFAIIVVKTEVKDIKLKWWSKHIAEILVLGNKLSENLYCSQVGGVCEQSALSPVWMLA